MRKITHVTVWLLLALTMLTACKKNIVDGNAVGGSNYQQQLNSRSTQYKENLGSDNMPDRPNLFYVLCADVKGAIEGAAVGYRIGGKYGASIGAAIGGAAASLRAALSIAYIDTAKQTFDYGNTIASSFNIYNSIGYYHYQCINEAYANSGNYKENGTYSNSRFYNFSTNYLVQQGEADQAQVQSFPLSVSNNTLAVVVANGNRSVTDFLISLTINKQISAAASDALKPYLECLELTVNVSNFIAYSLDAEKIIAFSTLSDSDKQMVLCTMSTARYGVDFWRRRL